MARPKVLTVLGTRPEIIRLSRLMPLLDQTLGRDHHAILHTGQNYDPKLSDIFFRDLGLRAPDFINHRPYSSLADQIAQIYCQVETAIAEFRPDRAVILGDTNTGLAAVICERLGVPVYHMEAGNRCYDLTVPEERNRRVIDAVSTFNLPYTELSRQNLLREGAQNQRVFVTGNPIAEVLDHYADQINHSTVLSTQGLSADQYVIATAHRAENVDNPQRLKNIFAALCDISTHMPVIFSCHPKTQQRLRDLGLLSRQRDLRIIEPLGFFDFAHLEKHSYCAVTDSGTVQEEMCLFGRPTITIRTTTERPETLWCGSNVISGVTAEDITECYSQLSQKPRGWSIPQGYELAPVSARVCGLLCSNLDYS